MFPHFKIFLVLKSYLNLVKFLLLFEIFVMIFPFYFSINSFLHDIRDGNFGPIQWDSSVYPKVGLYWTVKLLIIKKSDQIWFNSV